MKLPRTTQCAKCPWKVSTNPFEIPDGYDIEKHKKLSCTISEGKPDFCEVWEEVNENGGLAEFNPNRE